MKLEMEELKAFAVIILLEIQCFHTVEEVFADSAMCLVSPKNCFCGRS